MAIRVMVADDNPQFIRLLHQAVDREPGMEWVGAVGDGRTALTRIPEWLPDVLILDLVMPHLDGFGVLEALRKNPPAHRVRVLVVSAFGQEELIVRAMTLGARYYCMKPLEMAVLLQRVREVVHAPTDPPRSLRDPRLEEEVARMMNELGVPAHYKGYAYLREAILLVNERPELLSRITKGLYPAVARRFGSTPGKVERAIRHAIEATWTRGNLPRLNALFTYGVDSRTGKPTNSTFIARMADELALASRRRRGLGA
ncbi:sporulation transcription factor Spo0A [Limnochorda sp.]|uniref:sporulation transcription factor Spo0A n=1 Tax=Limnochorda sp. TaxID=1940279 RepID=UPI001DE05D1D|nr:sporulation transcription factor Spo0A [Bacillota bacterium]MBO2518288.1 sporulation transcription factor Spo0A [Bacillota bacterium]